MEPQNVRMLRASPHRRRRIPSRARRSVQNDIEAVAVDIWVALARRTPLGLHPPRPTVGEGSGRLLALLRRCVVLFRVFSAHASYTKYMGVVGMRQVMDVSDGLVSHIAQVPTRSPRSSKSLNCHPLWGTSGSDHFPRYTAGPGSALLIKMPSWSADALGAELASGLAGATRGMPPTSTRTG